MQYTFYYLCASFNPKKQKIIQLAYFFVAHITLIFQFFHLLQRLLFRLDKLEMLVQINAYITARGPIWAHLVHYFLYIFFMVLYGVMNDS